MASTHETETKTRHTPGAHTQHLNEMVSAQNAFLDFKRRLEAIAKGHVGDGTRIAIEQMLGFASDMYHDEIGPALRKAESAVAEFENERESESVRQEMSMLMHRQVGR